MLVLRTFGAVSVASTEGRPIGGAAAQRRLLALLALLAVAAESGMSRDQILGLLWPEGDPDKTRHALTQTLYHIRKALGCDDLFILTGADIRLNPERISSDVGQFAEQLAGGQYEQAVELYRGAFLDGFFLADATEFEQWASSRRRQLESDVARALEQLATAAEGGEDWTAAVTWRKRHVAIDRLSSAATVKLMRAMAASGDPAGALQHARVHTILLREELDIDPDPLVAEVAEQLRIGRTSGPQEIVARQTPEPAPRAIAVAAPDAALEEDDAPIVARASVPWHRSWLWRGVGAVCAAAATILIVAGARRAGSHAAAPVPAQTATVDLQSVAVTPFRVSGAVPALAYLKEGMVELLSTRLADDSAAQSVDPGAVLTAWRGANLNSAAEIPTATALDIAGKLKAKLVVVGSVVGGLSHVVINASLLTTATGAVRATSTIEGPADSITTLVDRLAGQLLALNAGEGDRLSDRTTPSLAALRAFLSGQSAYRRGDYAAAVPFYERSLSFDSTFALAALNLALAADRLNIADQQSRALALAWANRSDLSERDQAHLVAFAGPRYPDPSPEADQLAASEHAVALAPDNAGVWYELGERLFRGGREDAHTRAKAALERAIELEPGHLGARRLLIMLAARKQDTALLTRIATPAVLRDSMGELGGFLRWRVALARGDNAALAHIRSAFAALSDESLRTIAMSSMHDATGVEDGERAAQLRAGRVKSAASQLDALLALHALALNEGQPTRAYGITQQIEQQQAGSGAHLRLRMLDALYSESDTAARRPPLPSARAPTVRLPRRPATAPCNSPICVWWSNGGWAMGPPRRHSTRSRCSGIREFRASRLRSVPIRTPVRSCSMPRTRSSPRTRTPCTACAPWIR